MIQGDDYYAHPTLFDQCQAVCASRIRHFFRSSRPYFWSWVFHAFALLCYLGLVMIIANSAVAGGGVIAAMSGLQSFAGTIGVAMALAGGVHFQRIAWQVSPGARKRVKGDKQSKSGCSADRQSRTSSGHTSATVTSQQSVDQQETQVFFEELRKIGVNVAIAHAFYKAGIRSIVQFRSADARLLKKVHGIGPVTIERLRKQLPDPQSSNSH